MQTARLRFDVFVDPSVTFARKAATSNAAKAKSCSACAPSLGRRQLSGVTRRQRSQGYFSSLTPRTSRCIAPRATASTEEKTSSRIAELDPQTLKEKRRFNHLTQPWGSRETTLRTEADGIWTLTQPFQLGFGRFADARLRATVVRLDDGSLLVYGPVALTEECLGLVQSLGGPVSHVVIPNTSPEHAWFRKEWARRFPDAQWYAPVHLVREMSKSLKRDVQGLAGDQVPAAWGSVLQQVTFSTGGNFGDFQENVFFHTREKALMVADMAVWLDDKQLPSVVNRLMAKGLGVYNELGVLFPFRLYLRRDPEAAKAYCRALSELDFTWVIFGHGADPQKATWEDFLALYRKFL